MSAKSEGRVAPRTGIGSKQCLACFLSIKWISVNLSKNTKNNAK